MDFNACVYKSSSPTIFEGRWENLVAKYNLQDHSWLNDMYAIRTKWVRAYTMDYFAAGMTTTSRSESMNSFFDKYVQASTGLKEFIENSQKALEGQYLNKVREDHETEYKQMTLRLGSPLEMHGSKIYTKEMFRRYQVELLKSASYITKSFKEGGTYMFKMYLVGKCTVAEEYRIWYQLIVPLDGLIECSCKKFQHSGMICKHMLSYFHKKQKTMIPIAYITPMWTINGNKIAGPLRYTPPILANVGESQSERYSALCQSFQSLGAIGSCSIPRYNYVMDVIEREKTYVSNSFPEEKRNENLNDSFTH